MDRSLARFDLAIALTSNSRIGYARLKENVTNGKADNHEGIDFYRPVENPDKTKPLWGSNQWPDVSGFRERYQKWTEKMQTLGLVVMKAYAIFHLVQLCALTWWD